MCCDVCSHYDECAEKNSIKDNCCKRCSEYEYCVGEERYHDSEDFTDDDE